MAFVRVAAFAASLVSSSDAFSLKPVVGQENRKEPVSFMQTQALPKISSVMNRPGKVFNNLQAHLLELEQSLAEQQTKVNREVKKQKASYERHMANQDKMNKAQAEKNKIMKRKIARVQTYNADLNKKAHKMTVENDKIVDQLVKLQANISTAEEYSKKVLDSTDLAMANQTALSVLWELDAEDESSKLSRKHDKSIDDIAGDEFAESLLQIDSFLQIEAESQSESELESESDSDSEKGTGKLEASDYVSGLSMSLDDLEVEENASLASLKEEFDANMNKSTTKYTALIEEHAELNATFVAERETNKQLLEAVRFTADTHQDLVQRMKSLREYAATTADNELASLSFLQISKAKTNKTDKVRVKHAAKAKVQANVTANVTSASKPGEIKTLREDIKRIKESNHKLRKQGKRLTAATDDLQKNLAIMLTEVTGVASAIETTSVSMNLKLHNQPDLAVLSDPEVSLLQIGAETDKTKAKAKGKRAANKKAGKKMKKALLTSLDNLDEQLSGDNEVKHLTEEKIHEEELNVKLSNAVAYLRQNKRELEEKTEAFEEQVKKLKMHSVQARWKGNHKGNGKKGKENKKAKKDDEDHKKGKQNA